METLIASELSGLHPAYLTRLAGIRVTLRLAAVSTTPGEYVHVVAEVQGRVLYYSDLDEAWGLDTPDAEGGVREPAQFQLKHLLNQLFGAPNVRTCGV